MAKATTTRRLQEELRAHRVKLGIPQADVASALGVSRQMATKLESSTYEPSLTQLERLATALGLKMTVRLTRKGRS